METKWAPKAPLVRLDLQTWALIHLQTSCWVRKYPPILLLFQLISDGFSVHVNSLWKLVPEFLGVPPCGKIVCSLPFKPRHGSMPCFDQCNMSSMMWVFLAVS